MFTLYLRRLFAERRLRTQRGEDIELSRQLMAALDEPDEEQIRTRFSQLEHEQRMRVFSHLLQLVRGEDHEKLMRLANILGVPDRMIEQLRAGNAASRVDAIRVLERFGLPRALAAIRWCLLNDPDPDVRLEAAATLARLGKPPAPGELLDRLELRDGRVNRLHEAILRAGAPMFAKELTDLARNPASGSVRPLLVEALGWSEDFGVLAALGEIAGDDDPEVRAAAIRAASKLAHPGAAPWILPLLLDPFDQVRIQAVKASGKLGLTDAVPVLMGLTENQSWWVRNRAIEALNLLVPGQIRSERAIGLRQ